MAEPGQTDLVTRAQGGDAEAIGQLYDQHHEALFRYVWARVGERPLAEDLTGEVFMRMLNALPRYRATAAPFRAWLYQIARNLLVDHYRKMSGQSLAPLHEAETTGAEAGDIATLVEQQLTHLRQRRADGIAGLARLGCRRSEQCRALGDRRLHGIADARGGEIGTRAFRSAAPILEQPVARDPELARKRCGFTRFRRGGPGARGLADRGRARRRIAHGSRT